MKKEGAALDLLLEAQQAAREATGWAFDGQNAPSQRPLPWDYADIVRDRLKTTKSVLDLGTGGGEVFHSLLAGYDAAAFATEEWEVNAPVARDQLMDKGVPLVQCSSLELPFCDDSFDLVLSRHEAIEPAEIDRVLVEGGTFVTQQVTHDSWREVHDFFPRATKFANHFVEYREALEALGFKIERAETCTYPVKFPNIASLVYMLSRDIWTIPNFDVRADLDAVHEMEDLLGGEDGVRMSEGRYIMIATKEPAER